LPAKGEVSGSRAGPNEVLRFFCAAPVERKIYILRAGERYAILAFGDGTIRLSRVASH